jgi:hypothetical protein
MMSGALVPAGVPPAGLAPPAGRFAAAVRRFAGASGRGARGADGGVGCLSRSKVCLPSWLVEDGVAPGVQGGSEGPIRLRSLLLPD